MNFQLAVQLIFLLAVLILTPIIMIWSMVSHFRTKPSDRPGGNGAAAGVANILDKIVQPSIEHREQAQQQITKRKENNNEEE